MNADGSNLTSLGVVGSRPQWSPDGKTIVFGTFDQPGPGSLWTINADGTQLRELATGLVWARYPSWSPDGSKIVFVGVGPDWWDSQKVYVMNADGSNVTAVTSGASFDDNPVFVFHPSWSPDGSKIIFSEGQGWVYPQELYTINPDGTNRTQITFDAASGVGNGYFYPAWQPVPTAFPFTGFFNPLGPAGTLNSVKAGSSVPVQFSLGADRGLNILAAGSPSMQAMSCAGIVGSQTTVDATTTAGSSGLTYDAVSGRYTYVMKTEKSWANTCRRLTFKLTDCTSHTADFKFR
jgi:tricorn protease-like protein